MTAGFENHVSDSAKTDVPKLNESTNVVFRDAYQGVGNSPGKIENTGGSLVSKGQLPGLDLVEHPGLMTETWNVAKELGKGALAEIEEHPLKLVGTAAIGLATGALLTTAAPEVLLSAAAGGIAYVGYRAYQNLDSMIHNTSVVANPKGHSAQEVAQSKQSVQNFGGVALETAVSVAAGVGGSMLGSAIKSAVSEAVVTTTSSSVTGRSAIINGAAPVQAARFAPDSRHP
jgi:hypothetical protein